MNDLINYIKRLEKEKNYCKILYEDYEKSNYPVEEKIRVFDYLNFKIRIIEELIFNAKNELSKLTLKGSEKDGIL